MKPFAVAIAAALLAGNAAPAQDKDPIADLVARVEAKLGPGEKPFTMVVTAKVKEGQEARFEAAAAKAVKATRQEPGNVAYDYYRDLDTPGRYIILERWKSTAALKEHLAAAHTRELLKDFAEIAEGPPQIQLYTAVTGK